MSVFIIADIGINHNGSVDLAKRMIDLSKETGADAVKFQKRDINLVYSKEILGQKRESPWGTTQKDQKEGLEFSIEQYKELDYPIVLFNKGQSDGLRKHEITSKVPWVNKYR